MESLEERNCLARDGEGRVGKLNDLPSAQRPRLGDARGFARFGLLRSRGTRFIHGERNGRRKKGMVARVVVVVVVDRGGAVGGIVFRRFDRSPREGEGVLATLESGARIDELCCARGTPGTINRFHAAVQWRRQLAPSTLI